MGVVLVLEPDTAQAEPLLRVLRKRVRAEAILVTSTATAIEVIGQGTPDLILVSALLAPRDEDRLVAHLRSLDDAAHLQMLTIPRLAVAGSGSKNSAERTSLGRFRKKKADTPARAGADPEVFAHEISTQLKHAAEIRSQGLKSTVLHDPCADLGSGVSRSVRQPDLDEVDSSSVWLQPDLDSSSVRLQPDLDSSSVWLQPDRDERPDPEPVPDFSSILFDEEPAEPEVAAAPPAPVLVQPAPVFSIPASVFDDVKLELEEAPAPPVSVLETVSADTGSDDDDWTSVPLQAEPDTSSVRARPERVPRRIWLQPDAEPEAVAAVEPVPPPVEQPEPVAPVAAVHGMDLLEDRLSRLARRFGFGSDKVATVEAESVQLSSSPLGLLRMDTPEKKPDTTPVVDDSAERLAAHVAAIEAEANLAAELERVRAEGEQRRLSELARLQAEADILRDAAIIETRAAAEREAREALATELTRVRSEAEGVFAADLARVRAEVEGKLSAQVEAAETRLALAEQARNAAETASAAALAHEVARVRGEAEARLQVELERIRTEAEAARLAEQSHAKHASQKLREAAARDAEEARAKAEAAAQRSLDEEMARVRAQADKFLQAEIERVRADAQERQAAELNELRAQMAEIRDTAARTAAEQSADYYKIWQPPAPPPPQETAAAAPRPMAEGLHRIEPSPELAEKPLSWVKWALPTAAALLLMVNHGIVIETFASFMGPSPKKMESPARVVEPVEAPVVVEKTTGSLKVASTPVGARLLVDGKNYGGTPLTIPDLKPGVHTLVLRTSTGSVTRRITVRAGQTAIASEGIFSGWLAIYSTIPLNISLNGKPATVASDGKIMTPPGSYEVTLVNERFNYHGSRTLVVRPGEVTAHTVSIPSASVKLVAPDGAAITVDGRPTGKAPLGNMYLPLGTHEITATLPDSSARSATIAVRHGEITEARLGF